MELLIDRMRFPIEREHSFKMLLETPAPFHELLKREGGIAVCDRIPHRLAVSQLRVQCAQQVLVNDGKRAAEPIIAGSERVQRLIQDGLGVGHEVYQSDTDKLIGQPTLSDHRRRILGFLATARARAVANALKAVFSK